MSALFVVPESSKIQSPPFTAATRVRISYGTPFLFKHLRENGPCRRASISDPIAVSVRPESLVVYCCRVMECVIPVYLIQGYADAQRVLRNRNTNVLAGASATAFSCSL